MKTQFSTFGELRSLLKRYVKYCYFLISERNHYTDKEINRLTKSFMRRFKSKNDIVGYFQNHVFIYPYSSVLSPTSYYDLELKLSIRGF